MSENKRTCLGQICDDNPCSCEEIAESWSLSSKIEVNPWLGASCRAKDIKEFIKRLKDEIRGYFKEDQKWKRWEEKIDKLAGEKLI